MPRLSRYGYITYLRNPSQHTNTYTSHPGWGKTRAESQANSLYYANQLPWVVTVLAMRAPMWAYEQATENEAGESRRLFITLLNERSE